MFLKSGFSEINRLSVDKSIYSTCHEKKMHNVSLIFLNLIKLYSIIELINELSKDKPKKRKKTTTKIKKLTYQDNYF